MSEAFGTPAFPDNQSQASTSGSDVAASMAHAATFIGQFSQAARAESCVGPEQIRNGHTVIPLATVSVHAGFGMGFGGGSDASAKGQGSGGAAGGGGRGSSRVIAVVDISEASVSVRPVFDVTSILLAFIALAGIATVATRGPSDARLPRLLRKDRQHRELA
jgi:uncharacterized spore protein YtfJ